MKRYDSYVVAYYFFLVWGIQLVGYPSVAGFIAFVCAAYILIQGVTLDVFD